MASQDDPALKQLYRTFITGCHILHYHGVLDAYGHLSARHPSKPEIFIMSRYIAPGTISSERDLIEYRVEDAEPVDPGAPKGYSERCIHSELYKRYPGVQSVIHSHSEAVVPYSISGTKTPIFDIAYHLLPTDAKDMLVRNTHLGAALAACFSDNNDENHDPTDTTPKHAVVLMRGHGFTTHASSIQECVLRAIYTQKNAGIQTTALITHNAFFKGGIEADAAEIKYLDEEEAAASTEMTKWSAYRPWGLWVREVEAQGMYVNQV
ncbi:hypothetical protein VTN00DRAFT_286 [Thermoascus crustaceus]|uniref:uncharacterized protein n=1 Tax=Thermoascus crustaceus TaxID=5088 RepID=UPI0037439F3E